MKKDAIKLITYIALLGVICVLSFLVAKYIVRSSIRKDDIPIDTSVRLN